MTTAADANAAVASGTVSVDERGQMVLPKDLRDKSGIKTGDKLVVLSWKKKGSICCMILVKSDQFKGIINKTLGPMIKTSQNKR